MPIVNFETIDQLRAAHDLMDYGWDCMDENGVELPAEADESLSLINEALRRHRERELIGD